MITFRRTVVAATAVAAVGAAVFAPAAFATDDEHGWGGDTGGATAVGLVDGTKLVAFDVSDPGATQDLGAVTLDGDARLVGIDYRVQDGKLYGVGDEGGLYVIDHGSATAEKIGDLTVDLSGDHFGVDFNPAANALRVISDTGQNLRQPFANRDTGAALAATATDTALTNPVPAPGTGTTPAKGVTGAAYTNNDLDATTATTLYDLDTTLDRIAIQSPANAGTLAPTGNLPANVGPDAGFDIVTVLEDGRAVGNLAFAAVEVDGKRLLWAVDTQTGDAADLGHFGAEVTDLAIKLNH